MLQSEKEINGGKITIDWLLNQSKSHKKLVTDRILCKGQENGFFMLKYAYNEFQFKKSILEVLVTLL